MDALNQAKDAIDWADGEKSDLDDYFFRKAQAYAAIAQAEAATRQAAAMERIAEILDFGTSGGTDYSGAPMRVFRTEQLR